MKKIDLEAHFYTGSYLEYLRTRTEMPREETYEGSMRLWYGPGLWEPHGPEIDGCNADLGEGRLRAMDEAGIDVQVLSLSTPGCEQFSEADGVAFARSTNDELSAAVRKYPDRFIGLAALPAQSPEQAADELERAVTRLGLSGAKVHSHIGDSYLDEERFRPIFATAERLDVPIYLHPSAPNTSTLKAYADYGFALAGPAWGFGAEASLQAMRLIYSGLFDEHPRLKIILGHLGEGLIFWIDRMDFVFKKPWMTEGVRPKIRRLPSEYIRDNFMITTSGMFSKTAFVNVLTEIGAERMMFATDYPYENSRESVRFIEAMPLSPDDSERICHRNAEALFRRG